MSKRAKPDILSYHNYRKLLKDLFSFHQKENRHFTYRYFSMRAGFASPSALNEIIAGKKNLTQSSIVKMADGFKLTKTETEYFTNLVYFNQSKTEKEKTRYFQEISRIQKSKKGKTLTTEQFEYYSSWHNCAVRELICTKGFKNDPEWIASRLNPKITPAEAANALNLLQRLKLVKTEADGTLSLDSPKLEVDPDVTTLSIRNFNRDMIRLGSESIERFPQAKREVSGITVGVSKEAAEEMKSMVREFKKQLLNFAINDKRTSEEVYQMNFQFFPLSESELS
ncbi:MAG: TIGR02147 family protein [Fibrobacteres bacterium]|nr:TIGR02147 family protein [Fibrobacterota bacterium]